MKTVMGTCALCHQRCRLIQSHIFPESFYKNVYSEETHKFVTLSTNPTQPIGLEQLGIREHLLCGQCDGKVIGKYDDYIARWLYEEPVTLPDRYRYSLMFKGVNYALMRLFQLSLLWRFHIAKGHGFRSVDLGTHSETIRNMLLTGDAGTANYFPCILMHPKDISPTLTGGITCPVSIGTDQWPVCRAIAVGIVWMWIMRADASSNPMSEFAVSTECQMHIVLGTDKISDGIKNEFIVLDRAKDMQPNADKLSKWGFGQ